MRLTLFTHLLVMLGLGVVLVACTQPTADSMIRTSPQGNVYHLVSVPEGTAELVSMKIVWP
ncbi:hypothetical protein [Polycladidibacter hongkongensis]|uniref:hypothetical protein n=1 Tax=Polycladidibacter hongkongensis TaxID=1647556 RepID=UPI001AD92410|nr:hypothetical protein [Pseudovibrio hongkongensis]